MRSGTHPSQLQHMALCFHAHHQAQTHAGGRVITKRQSICHTEDILLTGKHTTPLPGLFTSWQRISPTSEFHTECQWAPPTYDTLLSLLQQATPGQISMVREPPRGQPITFMIPYMVMLTEQTTATPCTIHSMQTCHLHKSIHTEDLSHLSHL